MSSKLKKKVGFILVLDKLMDDDFSVAFELFLLASNIKKELCDVLDNFLSFFKNMMKEKITTCFY
jgi:hypothetical protein